MACCLMAPSYIVLTYWGSDKMAAIFVDDMFLCIYLNENFQISNFKISLKYVP